MTPRRDLKAVRLPASFLANRLTKRPPSQSPVIPKRPLGRNLWLAVWLLIVIAAAQIVLYSRPLAGVYVNAAALASLLYLGIQFGRSRQLVISVAIIPVSMLVGMSLPAVTPFQRQMVFTTILLILGLVYQYLFTLDFPREHTKLRLNRRGHIFALPLMIVLGQLIGLLGYVFLRNQYDFNGSPLSLVVSGAIIAAITEEIIFRGLIQQRAMILFHPAVAAALSATLYTLLTLGHRGGALAPLVGGLVGIATSIVYMKKQNILLTMAINLSSKVTYIGLVAVFVLR